MVNYTRVDYTKTDGKPSSAYYDVEAKTGFDVYTREPVTLIQDQLWQYHEYNTVEASKPVKTRADAKPKPVTLRASYSLWQVIPVGLFGLACIWLQLTFLK